MFVPDSDSYFSYVLALRLEGEVAVDEGMLQRFLDTFDVTPDAERFLVVRRSEMQIRPVFHLIVGWEGLLE